MFMGPRADARPSSVPGQRVRTARRVTLPIMSPCTSTENKTTP